MFSNLNLRPNNIRQGSTFANINDYSLRNENDSGVATTGCKLGN